MSTFSELIQTEQQEEEQTGGVVKGLFKIAKSDDSKRLAFGWANVAANEQGEILQDWQGDLIEAAVLEQAAYNFVRLYRDGGEMHERGGCAELVESVV